MEKVQFRAKDTTNQAVFFENARFSWISLQFSLNGRVKNGQPAGRLIVGSCLSLIWPDRNFRKFVTLRLALPVYEREFA